MGLSWSYDSNNEFNRLTLVVIQGPFLFGFFFQFHPLTWGRLRNKLHNLFLFIFYGIIVIS